jgi:glycine/D-amino acid oxidase-like deaminating enzyme
MAQKLPRPFPRRKGRGKLPAMQDVLVIGAGVVGSAVAWRLAAGGAGVTLVDPLPPGSLASARSFGWINASFTENPDYFAFRREAIAAHHRMEAELGPVARWGGSLWWEEEGVAFDRQFQALAGAGYDVTQIDAAAFARLAPHVADPPARCLFVAGEGAVEGAALAARLAAAAAGAGARVIAGAAVDRLVVAGGRVTGVETSFGRLAAGHVVLAAGVATQALAATAGARVPVEARPGLILQTRPVAPVIDHLILAPGIHFRQTPEGALVAGEVFSGDGPDPARLTRDPQGVADEVLARLSARLPGVDLQLAALGLGLRPVPPDGLPAIGEVMPGLTVAVMHSGVTLAPLVGELVAAELSGRLQPMLAPYRPGRFSA